MKGFDLYETVVSKKVLVCATNYFWHCLNNRNY